MRSLSAERWRLVETILDEILSLPNEVRSAHLARRSDDPELRQAVVALLAADEARDGPLDGRLDGSLGSLLAAVPILAAEPEGSGAPAVGEVYGDYRAVAEIGVGGMSRVFRGERLDGALGQPVAIKVLLPVPGERAESLRRFRAEGRILAALSHPNIARVLDAGVTRDGKPFLVMELVHGAPLTEHCATHDLPLEQRLELFLAVCDAVEHAHRRLVVHRDLKPSNVLVTEEGEVKLLDFGIAKLLDDDAGGIAEGVFPTRTGLLMMTPDYAAPEQLRGGPITTATDVYSLGVVLYELLTGMRPYDLRGKGPSEIERLVCEAEPSPPSTGRSPRDRGVTLPTRRRPLAADLDVIVLEALRKEPERRYGSARQLADDLRRYRRGEPVLARPATLRYRAAKFVLRHRLGVAAAALLSLALAAVTVTMTLQQAATAAQRDRAEREAEKARQVTAFLVQLFEANDPAASRGEETTARELLQRGLERVDRLPGDPRIRAELLGAIGAVYASLGSYGIAEEQLRRALDLHRRSPPPGELHLAETLTRLAGVLTRNGDYDEAAGLYAEAREILRHNEGDDGRRTLALRNDEANLARARGDLAAAAERFAAVLAAKEAALGETDESVAATLADLADLVIEQGDQARAEVLLRRAIAILDGALGEDHPRALVARQRLARAYLEWGDYDAAQRLGEEIAELQRRHLGPQHPAVADTLNGTLAAVRYYRGDFAGAEAIYREVVAIRTAALGAEHPDVAIALGNLSMMLVEQGQIEEGEAMARQVLALKRKIHQPGHPSIASSLHTLAIILQRQGKLVEAESLLREALAIRLEQLGPTSPRVASVKHELGVIATERRRFIEAESLFREALAIRRAAQTPNHPHIWADLEALAVLYELWGKTADAQAVRAEIAELFPERAAS